MESMASILGLVGFIALFIGFLGLFARRDPAQRLKPGWVMGAGVLMMALGFNLDPGHAGGGGGTVQAAKPVGDASAGKRVYAALQKKYPVAKVYALNVRGILVSEPHVAIYVPVTFWKQLSEADKRNLAAYMPQLVAQVKASPETYVGVKPEAPYYGRALQKVAALQPDDWEIIGGEYKRANHGMAVTPDTSLMCGDGNCD